MWFQWNSEKKKYINWRWTTKTKHLFKEIIQLSLNRFPDLHIQHCVLFKVRRKGLEGVSGRNHRKLGLFKLQCPCIWAHRIENNVNRIVFFLASFLFGDTSLSYDLLHRHYGWNYLIFFLKNSKNKPCWITLFSCWVKSPPTLLIYLHYLFTYKHIWINIFLLIRIFYIKFETVNSLYEPKCL